MLISQIFLSVIILIWLGTIFWSVKDISKASYRKRTQKTLWTNLVVIFPFLGLIIYLAYGRGQLFNNQNFVNH